MINLHSSNKSYKILAVMIAESSFLQMTVARQNPLDLLDGDSIQGKEFAST